MKKSAIVMVGILLVSLMMGCGAKESTFESYISSQSNDGNSLIVKPGSGNAENPDAGDGLTGADAKVNGADPVWEGFYFQYYSDSNGFIYVLRNAEGNLDVEYNLEGIIGNVTLTQERFEDNSLEGEEFCDIIGDAVASESGKYYRLDLLKSNDGGKWGYDNYSYSVSFYVDLDGGSREIEATNLYKIDVESHDMPEGYADHDYYGLLDAAMNDTTGNFTPETTDYMVSSFAGNTKYVYDQTTWKEIAQVKCDTFELYSFDGNRVCIDKIIKDVFASEEDAQLVEANSENPTLVRVGNVTYCKEDYYSNSGAAVIFDAQDAVWYYDCHYAYMTGYDGEDDTYKRAYYLSVPFTKNASYSEIGSVTPSFAKYAVSWDGGYRKCIEPECKASTLQKMWYNGFIMDELRYPGLDNVNSMRIYDNYGVGVLYNTTYYEELADMGTMPHDCVRFTKTELLGDNIVKITDYNFYVEDGDYTHVSATFDNFDTIGADAVESHTYDMSVILSDSEIY